MNTSKLRKNINKSYKHYDLEHPFDTITITKFGTMGIGVFTVAILEYGCYLETVGGLVLAAMVATTAGIGVYEDIKEGM